MSYEGHIVVVQEFVGHKAIYQEGFVARDCGRLIQLKIRQPWYKWPRFIVRWIDKGAVQANLTALPDSPAQAPANWTLPQEQPRQVQGNAGLPGIPWNNAYSWGNQESRNVIGHVAVRGE